jgi:glutathione S-transferase
VLTLHTTPISANGRKPLALAKHLGLPVRVELVNVYEGEGQTSAYRGLNPWGKIPTLVDGDFVLWESNAILFYLAESYADFALSSRDAKQRANILRWTFWEASHWQPALTPVLAPRVRQILFPDPSAAAVPTDWDNAEVVKLLRALEALLEAQDFMCGPALSIADFSIGGMTTYFRATEFPYARWPAVTAWLARMDAVPAWAGTAAAPWI